MTETDRQELLARFEVLQQEWEDTMLPTFAERVLSIRLTTQQMKVLALVIVEQDGMTIASLAGALEVSLPTMSGIVDRLEEHDMVHRIADHEDQRVRRVLATTAGRNVVRRLATATMQPNGLPVERLSLSDLRAVVQGMGALLEAVRIHHPTSVVK